MRLKLLFKVLLLGLVGVTFLVGCSGRRAREARLKERQEITRQTQMFCEFVSGEEYPDIDVKVNIEMGKKCEKEKPFSFSHYVTPSKITGVLYCCHAKPPSAQPSEGSSPAAAARVRRVRPASPALNVSPESNSISEPAQRVPASVPPAARTAPNSVQD